jgi:hypothetical protein
MERSAFWNSNNGDRIYDAGNVAEVLSKLVSNGITYTAADNLQVTPGGGMDVVVQPGSCWINGYCYTLTDILNLTLATAAGSLPRVDRVVVRWSLSNRAINLAVLTGAPNTHPQPPALTRNAEAYEMGVADILVPAGAIVIQSGNITDTRMDEALCGLANSKVAAVYQ